MDGLSISPNVEYKFKSQNYDPRNVSDLVHASFGAKYANIFKLFKLLFAVHDPMVNLPSRNRAPNHEVENLFSHLIQVFTEGFELGSNLSSDEEDASF